MSQAKFFISFLLLATATAQLASAAPIDDLIAAARKEGTVESFAAGTLGAEGAQKLGEAFNKKYGLSLKTIPSSGMAPRKLSVSRARACPPSGTRCW
jgi:tripartite-type tricarboxylate transporter receptor subunit TctC